MSDSSSALQAARALTGTEILDALGPGGDGRAALREFASGVCLRQPRLDRKERNGPAYHKGWEIRLYADSESDVAGIVEALAALGLRAGRPYRKNPRRWIVPVYGRSQVQKVLARAAHSKPPTRGARAVHSLWGRASRGPLTTDQITDLRGDE